MKATKKKEPSALIAVFYTPILFWVIAAEELFKPGKARAMFRVIVTTMLWVNFISDIVLFFMRLSHL